MNESDARELKAAAVAMVPAPELPYQPPVPRGPIPAIGLIGCGGIANNHLAAYRQRNWPVTVLCDINLEAARKLRDRYFPDADITDDPEEVFTREDFGVLDLATHPEHRAGQIRRALAAGKHVLSQKPFVTDLREGISLIELAESRGLRLAVNQNGRWAPYFSYLRQAARAGLLGDIISCDIHIAWDHTWIEGTHFEKIHHIILYDFAIHWFDIVRCVFGDQRAESVFATVRKAAGQRLAPPLGAAAIVSCPAGLATLTFHATTRFGPAESIIVTGTKGTFRSSGPVCANNHIRLFTDAGEAAVELEGAWFNDGFAGSMGELLCAIGENREPENSARHNLASLELCFAAVASADCGQPVVPGEVTAIS